MPKVSVNIITYNRANYIKAAIESVLRQSFTNWELLILDGASTDNTAEVVDNFLADQRIKYVKLPARTANIPVARNILLQQSQGEYLAVLDSDDVWCDDQKLAQQVKFLDEHQDYVLSGGGVVLINDRSQEVGRYLNLGTDKEIRQSILSKNQFAHSSVVYRRTAALEVGSYNETLRIGEDYDLFLRLGKLGKVMNFTEYFLNYRVHSGSICVADRLTGLRNNILIITKYQKDYPNYIFAYTRRMIRLLGGYLLSLIKK